MTRLSQFGFREIWCVDFEFSAPPGNRPRPHTMVGYEVFSGKLVRLFGDELRRHAAPPYSIASDSLFVAYYASAELGCHSALGWPYPAYVLDLFPEFRNLTNGLDTPSGAGLIGALVYHGLDAMDALLKDSMQKLAMRGEPYTAEEKKALLDYCESDVTALRKLLEVMMPKIDVPRAIHRGRYMKAAARMEYAGVPIDTRALGVLRENWDNIQDQLIGRVDSAYGVYDGRTFKADRMAQYVLRNHISWPRLESGRLALDDETFKTLGATYPQIEPLRQLRGSLSQMRLSDLTVGADGRNRCLLSPFRARTGRNQPSNSKFIFGTSSWLHSLVRPTSVFGLAYLDWSAPEFGIAAALSQDPVMIEAYRSGDPYLAFAKKIRAVPAWATKATHRAIREQFKTTCGLGVNYGMEADSLALRIGRSKAEARELLRLHHETYRKFWKWSDAAVDQFMMQGSLRTVFGWTIHFGASTKINARFIRNFPVQANGSEMLRLACCLATERGIEVCAPIHDGILIEARLEDLESSIEAAQTAMVEASKIVLGGFALQSEVQTIKYPERLHSSKGEKMWSLVWDCIAASAVAVPA